MRALLLLLLAATVGLALLCLSRGSADSQSAPFAITVQYCHVCEDGMLDWGQDQNYFEAEGNLAPGQTFIWLSPYPATVGIRRANLTFDGLGVAQLIGGPSSQRIVGPGSMCLAYWDSKAAVVIRGFGQARAVFDDGINNGCW